MPPRIPLGTKKIVIFDTNAYRVLTFGLSLEQGRARALQLRVIEQKIGNFALANTIVIWELIAHLADRNDPAYNYCLNALVALGEHTWSPFDVNAGICRFADAESAVCHELFQKTPAVAKENNDNIAKLANYVTKNAPCLSLSNALTNIKIFSAELKKREAAWLADMQKILTKCDPVFAKAWVGGTNDKNVRRKLYNYFCSQDFMDAWAVIMVVRYANLVGIKLNSAKLKEKAETMKIVFPTTFHLMSSLFQKFSNPRQINLNSQKKKWENFMCDLFLCFSVGAEHEIGDAPIFFVTGDNAIKQAADAAQCSNRVINLDQYLRDIGL